MDSKPKALPELLDAIHEKFGSNLKDGSIDYHLAEKHELRARIIQQIGVILGKKPTNLEHQKLIAKYFDEIFGDMVCTIYFSFSGLDNPARVILRRALELALVAIAYWDNPTAFWGWNSNNDDISFTELEKTIGSIGYQKFLEAQGCSTHADAKAAVKTLRDQYSKLSNVVHPKPYNFETGLSNKFAFSSSDLKISLEMLENVQTPFIKILICRFNFLSPELKAVFPNIDQLL